MTAGRHVLAVATADTKGEELAFLAEAVAAAGAPVLRVDVGTRPAVVPVEVTAAEVAAHHPEGAEALLAGVDRGAAVAAMGEAFAAFVARRGDVAGVVGIGGGGGTSIITAGMRRLPLGVPKLMVSTLASGDTGPFVDVSDIIMMPAVTDLAGLNAISRRVLWNAAQAIAGMARTPAPAAAGEKPSIGLTMFGVTTPCVTAVADALRPDHDCLVFHATGTGGRTMEKLADSGLLAGVIDITTTEVADLLLGGVLPAAEDRFGAVARTRIPCVASAGALDMVNFWAPASVPERYHGRLLHRHNPNVTLMRTTPVECRAIGDWIGRRLAACQGPLRFLIPERGVSALDAPGGAFHDPEADAALFAALEAHLGARAVRLPLHVNEPAFAAAAVAAFRELSR